MEATRADIEAAASHLVARSNLVERLVHGSHDWQIAIGGAMHRPDLGVSIEDGAALVVTFYVHYPEADGSDFEIYCDGELIHVVPGRIVRGKPARLNLRFAGAPEHAGV